MSVRPSLKLVPPLAEEFSVYGGPDTVSRAREWALSNHLLLVREVPACAHGLYLMASCPNGGARCCRAFDHTDIWLPDDMKDGRPFILTHPYTNEVSDDITGYAAAHGLAVQSRQALDGWYGHDSLPIRLTIPENWPIWPLEVEASALLAATPVAWPS
jgi:hypothetical protein